MGQKYTCKIKMEQFCQDHRMLHTWWWIIQKLKGLLWKENQTHALFLQLILLIVSLSPESSQDWHKLSGLTWYFNC